MSHQRPPTAPIRTRERHVSELQEAIRQVRALYPDPRSAVLPALRLAQERDGWLPPGTLREVAEALEATPAYCLSVASFYDQFHLEPVGRHLVEVCTNVSCAVAGAQQVVEALERELGVRAGSTAADGSFTLRAVECLGGCGWATVVAVDGRQRLRIGPGDVAALAAELRDAGA
jgi:NADH:ubiquinone oxidoreductase subunit E